jgi:hypothetical protein
MQAAAVWCVNAQGGQPACSQYPRTEPCIGTALGTVAMQHVDIEASCQRHHPSRRARIAEAQLAPHWHPVNAERDLGRQSVETRVGQRVASIGTNNCDLVAGARLRGREVADVAEQTADGRTEAVEDAKPCLHTGPWHVLGCAFQLRCTEPAVRREMFAAPIGATRVAGNIVLQETCLRTNAL